ncbi:hypothetical protein [Streptomyces sp. NPDC048663]|uniref:hypothetical protein n=1 Tax=Streptomyces sp. NPDC048663 TaxID=3155638 RepID=UPI003425A26F
MTPSAVLPAPAARPSRTAAGRRALRLAVLAGGLFALALLCGGRAHAADGAPAVPSTSAPASLVSPLDVEKVLPSAGTATDDRAPDERPAPAQAAPAQPTPVQAKPAGAAPPEAPLTTTPLTTTPLTATTPGTDAPCATTTLNATVNATASTAATATATPSDASATRRATSPQGLRRTAPRTSTAASAAPKPPVPPVLSVVPVVGETVRSVTGAVTTTVTGTVTRTLDTVVTRGLGEVVRQISQLPGEATTLPGQLPTLPVPPGTPSTLPVPVPVPPVGSAPAPVTSAPGTAPARPAAPEEGRQQSPRTRTAATPAVPYGPRGTVLAAAPVSAIAAHPHTGGHRAAHAVDGPNRPAPAGDPDGALGKSVVDGGSARHADACAVTFADRAPLRLVPGTAAHTDAAGTPDRYRDIPVFPG